MISVNAAGVALPAPALAVPVFRSSWAAPRGSCPHGRGANLSLCSQTLGHLEKAVVLELTLKHVKALTNLIEQQQQKIMALQSGLQAGECSEQAESLCVCVCV